MEAPPIRQAGEGILEADPAQPRYILTVRGKGYMLAKMEAA